MVETNLALGRAHGHAKASAQQQENRASSPGLRRAGDWIKGGTAGARPLVKSAEQLRQPLEFNIAAHSKERVKEIAGLLLKTVKRKSKADQGIVVRPHRAVVVGHGIVARLAGTNGANSPTGEKFFGHQRCSQHLGALLFRDLAEQ